MSTRRGGSDSRSPFTVPVAMWSALAVALATVTLAATPVGGIAGFGDVDAGRFFAEPVQWMVDNDLTNGTDPTCFSPDAPVTRGQGAAFLWRMEGEPGGSPAHPFDDVTKPWQQDAVSWLFDNGITNGTSPTTFSPDDEMTRGQVAAMLHRLAGSPAAAPSGFDDVTKPWQVTPVGWMVENGITNGTSPTTFSPDAPTTRGEIAAFLHRYQGSPAVVIDPDSPFCAPPTTTTTTTTPPPVSGSAVFAANCAICHGPGGDGSPGIGPRLIGNTLSSAQIRNQVENGGGGMPPFGGVLGNAETTAVVAYVAGL